MKRAACSRRLAPPRGAGINAAMELVVARAARGRAKHWAQTPRAALGTLRSKHLLNRLGRCQDPGQPHRAARLQAPWQHGRLVDSEGAHHCRAAKAAGRTPCKRLGHGNASVLTTIQDCEACPFASLFTIGPLDAPCWLLYHGPIVTVNSFHALVC